MAVIAAPVSHKKDAGILSILPNMNGQLLWISRFIVILVETRGGEEKTSPSVTKVENTSPSKSGFKTIGSCFMCVKSTKLS